MVSQRERNVQFREEKLCVHMTTETPPITVYEKRKS